MVSASSTIPWGAKINEIPAMPLYASSDPKASADQLAPFALPYARDPALRTFLVRTADLLCDWIGEASRSRPLPLMRPSPQVAPGLEGADVDSLLRDLQQVMDGAYQPSHPGALAHLDPPPLTASIAAELVCAGLNNNLLAEELSPGLTSLEHSLCVWFCNKLGLPEGANGVLASGGTLSNLMALVTAREVQDGVDQGVVLCSEDAHVSLTKAQRVMGLGADALIALPVDAEGRLCVEAVESSLKQLRSEGRACIAVVATAGTTVRGAIDPLPQLARVCRDAAVWLHVDAAIGGVFALSTEHAELMQGLHQADSITLNPQKLLGITKASSLLLMRKSEHLQRAFATGLPYMDAPTLSYHGGESGIQGTRPAEVLKLWLGLRQLGETGIEAIVSSAMQRRRQFSDQLDAERLMLLSGDLHLQTFHPRGLDADQCMAWSERARRMLLNAGYLLSRPTYNGQFCLKAVFGNPHTSSQHLEDLATRINSSL